jgi:hypothetical protein
MIKNLSRVRFKEEEKEKDTKKGHTVQSETERPGWQLCIG